MPDLFGIHREAYIKIESGPRNKSGGDEEA